MVLSFVLALRCPGLGGRVPLGEGCVDWLRLAGIRPVGGVTCALILLTSRFNLSAGLRVMQVG